MFLCVEGWGVTGLVRFVVVVYIFSHYCFKFDTEEWFILFWELTESWLRSFSGWFTNSPTVKLWLPRYNWNIVESSVKHHQTNKQTYYFGWLYCWWVLITPLVSSNFPYIRGQLQSCFVQTTCSSIILVLQNYQA